MAQIIYRPLDVWPGASKRPVPSKFKAKWRRTIEDLDRELQHLKAESIVLQLFVSERDIRVDGGLRGNVKPSRPGVILSFSSRIGPMRYAVDTFNCWRANVRAIALGLQCLRRVDTYGITQRSEQYTGWTQLTAGTVGEIDREAANAILDAFDGDKKRALRETHPDHGGSKESFTRVQKAIEVLGV